MYQTSPYHNRLFSSNTSRSSLYISHAPTTYIYNTSYVSSIILKWKNVNCEIEGLCKLRGILRPRVLRFLCDLIKNVSPCWGACICASSSSSRLLVVCLFILPGRSRSPTRNRNVCNFLRVVQWSSEIRFHSYLFSELLGVPPLAFLFLALRACD